MEKEKIVVFGASDHTRYTIDIIEQAGLYEIVGILDFALEKGSAYGGYEILGRDEDLPELMASLGFNKGIIAIGENYIRYKVVSKVSRLSSGFSFVSAIHPSAIMGKNVEIGAGTMIMAGVIINNDTVIGQHCFLATKASIDHDSSLGDYSSLSPGVTTGGSVKIGYCTAIGLGANILHGKTIGDHSVVGSGALVVKNIGDNVVAYGAPAREIRRREIGEKYL